MSIQVCCSNGHKLKVKDHWSGKTGSCPKCGVSITVPDESASTFTDEDALSVIGDYVPATVESIPIPDVKIGREVDDAYALDEYEEQQDGEPSGLSLLRSSLVRHKKSCENCGTKADMWAAKCRKCGTYFDEA